MNERQISTEFLPLNQAAEEIGTVLNQVPSLNELTTIKTPYGTLERIGEPRAAREGIKDIPLTHQHKKHLFRGKIEILDLPVVITYFSGEDYCQDVDYFRREYENSRGVYSGQTTAFTDRKVAPWLYGDDDETMTLIVEAAAHDLTSYYRSTSHREVEEAIRKSIELINHVWETSRRENNTFPGLKSRVSTSKGSRFTASIHPPEGSGGFLEAFNDKWPRYIAAFLVPEYPHLRDKALKDYLQEPSVIGYYQETQAALRNYLSRLGDFERGFGFADVKPDNLVEDNEGKILFIDVAKPEFAYHQWTTLGQIYQSVATKAPDSLFGRILKTAITSRLETDPQQALAIKLFTMGRMNRLLISCTLRNIVYVKEIGLTVDDNEIMTRLKQVRSLMEVDSIRGSVTV